jgi:hypothetical protein
MKTSLARLLLSGGLFAVVAPAIAKNSPPATEQARKVEALVTNGAALVDKDGRAAFAEFRKKDSEWSDGDTHVFVYDLKGTALLNPAFPQPEGTNVAGQKDAKGSLFKTKSLRSLQPRDRAGSATCSPSRDRQSPRRNGLT